MDGLLRPLQPLLVSAFTLRGSPVTWLEIVAFWRAWRDKAAA